MTVNSESTKNHRSGIRRMAVVFIASAALVGGAGAMAATASAAPPVDPACACSGSLNLDFGSTGWNLGSLIDNSGWNLGSLIGGSKDIDFGSLFGGSKDIDFGSLFGGSKDIDFGSLFGSSDSGGGH